MIRPRLELLALAGVLCCGAEAASPSVLGTWEIEDLYCDGCTIEDRSDVGARVRIAADSLEDPLSGGCDREVAVRALTPTDDVASPWRARISPEWIDPAAKDGGVTFVMLTCGGLDFVLLGKVAQGKLAYLTEGAISFLLRPITPPANAEDGSP